MAQTIGVLGIDIAKQVFHVVGMDDSGHVVLRKRIARGSDIHVMLTLRCSSRQVVVADEELNGTDMIGEFLGERRHVTCQT
jgi:hypothetical protein